MRVRAAGSGFGVRWNDALLAWEVIQSRIALTPSGPFLADDLDLAEVLGGSGNETEFTSHRTSARYIATEPEASMEALAYAIAVQGTGDDTW